MANHLTRQPLGHRRPHHPGRRSALRGVAAIEMALVLLPLSLLLVGAAEFGRAIYTYNVLTKSVRDAVRHLSLSSPGDVTRQTEAKCLAVFGNETCTGTALAEGLTVAMVTTRDALSDPTTHAVQPTGAGVLSLVSVTITGYQFQSVVSWAVPGFDFKPVSATMRGAS